METTPTQMTYVFNVQNYSQEKQSVVLLSACELVGPCDLKLENEDYFLQNNGHVKISVPGKTYNLKRAMVDICSLPFLTSKMYVDAIKGDADQILECFKNATAVVKDKNGMNLSLPVPFEIGQMTTFGAITCDLELPVNMDTKLKFELPPESSINVTIEGSTIPARKRPTVPLVHSRPISIFVENYSYNQREISLFDPSFHDWRVAIHSGLPGLSLQEICMGMASLKDTVKAMYVSLTPLDVKQLPEADNIEYFEKVIDLRITSKDITGTRIEIPVHTKIGQEQAQKSICAVNDVEFMLDALTYPTFNMLPRSRVHLDFHSFAMDKYGCFIEPANPS